MLQESYAPALRDRENRFTVIQAAGLVGIAALLVAMAVSVFGGGSGGVQPVGKTAGNLRSASGAPSGTAALSSVSGSPALPATRSGAAAAGGQGAGANVTAPGSGITAVPTGSQVSAVGQSVPGASGSAGATQAAPVGGAAATATSSGAGVPAGPATGGLTAHGLIANGASSTSNVTSTATQTPTAGTQTPTAGLAPRTSTTTASTSTADPSVSAGIASAVQACMAQTTPPAPGTPMTSVEQDGTFCGEQAGASTGSVVQTALGPTVAGPGGAVNLGATGSPDPAPDYSMPSLNDVTLSVEQAVRDGSLQVPPGETDSAFIDAEVAALMVGNPNTDNGRYYATANPNSYGYHLFWDEGY